MYQTNKDFRMRPEDVYSMMTLNDIPGTENMADQRTMHTNIAVKSSRMNSVPANYMSGILNNWRSATTLQNVGLSNLEQIEKARDYSSEKIASADPFVSAIAQIRNQPAGNKFTYGELCRLDPNADNICNILRLGATDRVHEANTTADWGGSDGITQAATMLSQSIPGLLMKHGLTRIVLRSTNHDHNGKITTKAYDHDGFSTASRLDQAVLSFIQDFEFQLIQDLTYQNAMSYMVEIQADLLGDTYLNISLDGSPLIEYVTPSFSDALIIPVLTRDNSLAKVVASDFDYLMRNVVGNKPTDNLQFGGGFGSV